jgi:hypothetical protein
MACAGGRCGANGSAWRPSGSAVDARFAARAGRLPQRFARERLRGRGARRRRQAAGAAARSSADRERQPPRADERRPHPGKRQAAAASRPLDRRRRQRRPRHAPAARRCGARPQATASGGPAQALQQGGRARGGTRASCRPRPRPTRRAWQARQRVVRAVKGKAARLAPVPAAGAVGTAESQRLLQRVDAPSASDRLSPPPRARWRALLISISLASRGGRACTMAPISLGVK